MRQSHAYATAFVSNNRDTHTQSEAALNPAVDRFTALIEDDQETFRETLERFLRLHSFLSQVVDFADLSLEKLALYGKALQLKLADADDSGVDVSDRVALSHLRTEFDWEGSASVDDAVTIDAQVWSGRGPQSEEAEEHLSVIVEEMNQRFGQELTDEDTIVLDQYQQAFVSNSDVADAALANDDVDAFKRIVFDPVFLDTIINQMDANEKIFKLVLADERMRALFADYLAQTVYDQVRHNSDPAS